MPDYVGEHTSIRDAIVCVEKRKDTSMRRHATLGDLGYSLVYRWPEDCRGKEWKRAVIMCLKAMEGARGPEQARAAFIAAAKAAEMLMVKEEYIQVRGEKRPAKGRQRSPDSRNA